MPGDDLYWNPELESEESIEYPPKEPYVDPWDLENYAYIREHLDSMELSSNPSVPSGSSGEFAEANSHSFYYVPANKQAGPPYVPNMQDRRNYDSPVSEHENYAAIDEVKMYDRRRTRSEMYAPSRRGRYMQEYESEIEESPYEVGTFKENPIFGIYDQTGKFRRVALPINYAKSTPRDRSLSFAYGDYEYDPYGMQAEIYSKLENISDERHSHMATYDEVNRNRGKPENFGLSQYGHLKIDYSYSWNNLNKYIKYT